MKLNGVFLAPAKKTLYGEPHWVAVWTTAVGNAIHDDLPYWAADSEPAAWAYAIDNPPTWEQR